MSLTIGPFAITGTDQQVAKIAQMAQHVSDVLGDRVKGPVNVSFLPRKQMPWADKANQIRAVAYTPNGHTIQISARLIHHVPETFAHESLHVLDDQWFATQQRTDILALMQPAGAKWNPSGYEGDGQETFAVYGSGALFGVVPAWASLYSHSIPQSAWPQLTTIALKDYGTPVPPPPPVPTAPDPAELQAQIDELQSDLDAANTLIATLQTKIAAAKADLT